MPLDTSPRTYSLPALSLVAAVFLLVLLVPATMASTMRAVVCSEAGGPEVLHVVDTVPTEALQPNTVRIRVVASAVNRADTLQRRGLYAPPQGASEILGLEAAGYVVAVADDAKQAPPVGSRVMALLAGEQLHTWRKNARQ